jgi:hypothetical protein
MALAVPAPSDSPLDDNGSILDAALRRRAELHDSTKSLIRALEAASPGREQGWLQRVSDALAVLREDFTEHVEMNEASDGIHAEMLHVQPRLASRVRRLAEDHVVISDRIDAAMALVSREESVDTRTQVAEVRDACTQVVALITRHRQRSSDLVYEAYNTDIGIGE